MAWDDPINALSATGQVSRVLLKLRYLRQFHMFTGRKLPITLAFGVLIGLAFGVNCDGFFVDPVLQSIVISPSSPQVDVDKTLQLQAFGTYDDGSRKQIKSGVSWSSDATDVATIDPSTGLLSGSTPGSSTITASSQGLDGTAQATVIGNVTAITVNPTSASVSIGGTGVAFTFAATPGPPLFITADNGGTLDVTPSDDHINCVVGVDGSNNPAEICSATTGAIGPYTLQMSYPSPSGGTVTSQTATLTIR